ncbi:uncharacterized protein ZBIST_0785 [Zygosaccharomyces bailii]|nr:uncharacterized protein ZBIST_0785 [Zygosaccharomyces bailii]
MSSAKGRTFTGCWPCRLKKRRCDENKPQCSLCKRHGDRCCYDVKLVWLDENIYKNAHGRYSSRAQLAGPHRRRRMSKKNLRSLISGSISPLSELDEDENDTGSYTISVRRLKIYDNAVDSVYGRGEHRNYSQRHVNWVLDSLLHRLESGTDKAAHRQGPFALFDGSRSKGVPSPAVSAESSAAQNYIDQWVNQEVGTLLWLQGQDPLLSNEQFRDWYLSFMRCNISIAFCHAMQDADPLKCVKEQCPQWIPLALTILVAMQGYTEELAAELSSWILVQQELQIWMLPTVSALVINSQSGQELCFCSKLLSNYPPTFEAQLLELQIAGKLVDQWRDKIIAQSCVSQDTTQSFPQLKFWQSQLDIFQSIPI